MDAIAYINELRRERNLPPLISTPLMTTMVVSIQWGETELPRERAKFYEACVKAIIQSQYISADSARDALVKWGGPWDDQRLWLCWLALGMHARGRGGAAIREESVRDILKGKVAPEALEAFIVAVRSRGGLLEERGEFFQFMHLTFQEFLAARLLAYRREEGQTELLDHITDSWWREVIILTYGVLRTADPEGYDRYLVWLSELPGDAETRLAGAELAASAVLEIERPDPDLSKRQADLLVTLLTDRDLSVSPVLRARAGRMLARLGDPRPGVGLRADGVPDIEWCDVPAGEFIMGDTEQTDEMAWDDEAPRHTEKIAASYRISRYPVTNAQFDAFVRDGGYTEKWRRCWTEAGWQWMGDRAGPYKMGGVFDLPNHPAVGVSWYEAWAFSQWLLEVLGVPVSLPTEAQWECAARGTDGRRYPWGRRRITPDHANFDMNVLNVWGTTAVGIFPKGASPCGAVDMSGNVWEWCLTKWRDNYDKPPDDDPAGEALRVLRGGSLVNAARRVRCAARGRLDPNYRDDIIGFRVVVSPVQL